MIMSYLLTLAAFMNHQKALLLRPEWILLPSQPPLHSECDSLVRHVKLGSRRLFDYNSILCLQISFSYSHCPTTYKPRHQAHVSIWQLPQSIWQLPQTALRFFFCIGFAYVRHSSLWDSERECNTGTHGFACPTFEGVSTARRSLTFPLYFLIFLV